MSLEGNKALSRAAIDIWSTGDVDRAEEIFSTDYVMHQHHDPDGTGDLDLAQLKAFVVEFRRGSRTCLTPSTASWPRTTW
jgi:hypothetical protein